MNPAQIPNPRYANSTFPLGLAATAGGEGFLAVGQRVEVGAFEAWICSQCGYSELYVQPQAANAALSALARTPGAGVYWVDETSPAYR